MRKLKRGVATLAVSFACVSSLAAQPQPATSVALTRVNIIPLDRERVLNGYTLIVRDGRIAELGPSNEVAIPAGTQVVDAPGKFVMPGLAEMHGHLIGDNTTLNERILSLLALHGVTTLRVMQGHPTHLGLRDRIERHELLGPRLYIAAPALSGNSAPNPEAGMVAVGDAKQKGFDLLKIQEGLSLTTFEAIARTADKLHMGMAGHVPAQVGVHRALQARFRSIDHLDGYLEALVPPSAQVDLTKTGLFGSALIDQVNEAMIDAIVQETKEAGTAIVPTETVARNFLTSAAIPTLFSKPELMYLPRTMVDAWKRQKIGVMEQFGSMSDAQRERYHAVRRKLIKAMQDAGVPVLLGSDSPQVLNVPGVSISDELELMVKAGLTPYQALSSGTRNVAAHFGTLDNCGTIEKGKRADLIVLDANPLLNVAGVRQRFGVFVNGHWVTRSEIDKRLQQFVAER